MKKYWRCFVCNDVHYGDAPPEICPTCKVRHAYIQISAREARTILNEGPGIDLPETEYRQAMASFVEGQEFQVNPDEEKVAPLIEGIFANERNHGLKYCPCRLSTGDFTEDLKLICPCHFRIHETYRGPHGECWCGLYVKRSP